MTVSTINNKIVYIANGATNTFAFPFAVRSGGSSDIQVFQTDTSGNITQLTQPTQYTVTLNAAIAPNPTPVGGSVNIIAAPANGVLVTILRTMSLTQTSSLANQGTLYQPVLESTDDNQEMQLQQVSELQGRAISVAVSDPTPTTLPPVAQRANLAMMFDSAGNPIAAAPGGANAPVSSAMAPVVNAATIATAVALLGLSGVAPEPSGTVKMFAGSVAPTGYLLCGGQSVTTAGFPALFAAIGYAYGGSGPNFSVPDLRGRVPAGIDNMNGVTAGRLTSNTISGGATTLGNNGGTEQVTITQGQLPAVAPTFTGTPSADVVHWGGNVLPQGTGATTVPAANNMSVGYTPAGTISNLGSGNPTPNVQPTIMLNYIIKT